ncbi:UDP-glucose 4-epimerase [Parelusimicrobium proximum]|uniref:NAD-dependent epimerase/dehydratase family protein n=1 Tax=Parelusimicrobium proximum TaxID=3228953 RepID=UPI003D173F67
MKKYKWLITGGSGFIGSKTAEILLKKGLSVRIFDAAPPSRELRKKTEYIKGLITDKKAVAAAAEGADFIIHMAALTSVKKSIQSPALTKKINIDGTKNVIAAAKKHRVKKVIFISSAAVYGDNGVLAQKETSPLLPLSPYAESKYKGELMFKKEKNLNYTILRLFNVYGPNANFDKQLPPAVLSFTDGIKHGRPLPVYGKGKQQRDFIFIEDVAEAVVNAALSAKTNKKIYNIASGKKYSLVTLIHKIEKISGKKAEIIFKPLKKGEVISSRADISKAKKDFGFKPKFSFERGLKITYEAQP